MPSTYVYRGYTWRIAWHPEADVRKGELVVVTPLGETLYLDWPGVGPYRFPVDLIEDAIDSLADFAESRNEKAILE